MEWLDGLRVRGKWVEIGFVYIIENETFTSHTFSFVEKFASHVSVVELFLLYILVHSLAS